MLVSPDSPICSKGWIGILEVTDCVTATVPRKGLKYEVEFALSHLTAQQAVSPQALLPYFPTMNEILGPGIPLLSREVCPDSRSGQGR